MGQCPTTRLAKLAAVHIDVDAALTLSRAANRPVRATDSRRIASVNGKQKTVLHIEIGKQASGRLNTYGIHLAIDAAQHSFDGWRAVGIILAVNRYAVKDVRTASGRQNQGEQERCFHVL